VPKTNGILESSLYVSDVPHPARFYEETFCFSVIKEFGERGCAMHAGTSQVLLPFKKGASRTIQSPHDRDGELHVAFAIASADQVDAAAEYAERLTAGSARDLLSLLANIWKQGQRHSPCSCPCSASYGFRASRIALLDCSRAA
jgi:Glyoxalase/Bleomycin resistance protein/Dioxygenase superfamily